MPYALKITWRDGGEAWVTDPPKDAVARYAHRDDAVARREALLAAIGYAIMAIDIVPAPRGRRKVREDE